MKTRTYTLYLVKKGTNEFEEIFTKIARERIKAGSATILKSSRLGKKAVVYVFGPKHSTPKWWSDLNTISDNLPPITNTSTCAVVVFKHVGRLFATTFAYGWQYIDEAKIEMDFGLKAAVNSLDDNKVKRIERNHLGEAMKGISHSAFQRSFQAFGIDEALDLVRRISGNTDKDDFANALAGAKSLKATKEMDILDLPDLAEQALTRFESNDYQQTSFRIIDKVQPILDKELLENLDLKTVESIKNGEDNFELSMPGWSEDDIVYYKFSGLNSRKFFPDLLMSNYRDALGEKVEALDVESIVSRHGISAEFNNDAMVTQNCSIKKALIGSIVLDDGLYATNEGEWFRLDEGFKRSVDENFRSLIVQWDAEPETVIQKISEDGKKTGFESELEYNKRCADSYGQICLDQKILIVPPVPHGRFEACDLLDVEGKRLIHVKNSPRRSSVLSHFFKQGKNSARLLKLYPEARVAMVGKVRDLKGDGIASRLEASLGDSVSGWTVEFHIIDAPREDGKFNIPFFSRVTFRDEVRDLRGMEFKVALKFIPV